MSDEAVVAIARVPLARSPRRLLAVPVLLVLGAVAAGVVGVLTLPGWAGFALIAVALLAVIGAFYLAAIVLTARLEVEVSTLHLRWFGSDRQYTLARGPVTRVILIGERAAKLRPRFGAFGWGLGPARLRGEETITLIRLARSPAVILVPTESGRVAVAPRSEEQFLEALAAAARVQQRLDMVAARTRAIPAAQPPPEPAAPEPEPVEPSRPLTGIERQLLEERLAAERAAALAAAEEERRAAERAAALAAAEAAAAAAAAAQRADVVPAQLPAAAPARQRRAIPRPALGRLAPPRARLLSLALAIVPLLAATALWGVAAVAGTSGASAQQAQQISVGLALAGPGAALAALAARAWFPRLVGLVVVTAVCALILIGRALIS